MEEILKELYKKLEIARENQESPHNSERDEGFFSGQISILEETIGELEELIMNKEE